jgi:hypothetical protein
LKAPARRGFFNQMTDTLAKVLIIGIPFALSIGWFIYWVQKLVRFHRSQKKKKTPAEPIDRG